MPTTMQDLSLTGGWVDIYTAASITPATALFVQNKSSTPVVLVITAEQPASDFQGGWVVEPLSSVDIDAGDSAVWIKGNGPVNIQVAS